MKTFWYLTLVLLFFVSCSQQKQQKVIVQEVDYGVGFKVIGKNVKDKAIVKAGNGLDLLLKTNKSNNFYDVFILIIPSDIADTTRLLQFLRKDLIDIECKPRGAFIITSDGQTMLFAVENAYGDSLANRMKHSLIVKGLTLGVGVGKYEPEKIPVRLENAEDLVDFDEQKF